MWLVGTYIFFSLFYLWYLFSSNIVLVDTEQNCCFQRNIWMMTFGRLLSWHCSRFESPFEEEIQHLVYCSELRSDWHFLSVRCYLSPPHSNINITRKPELRGFSFFFLLLVQLISFFIIATLQWTIIIIARGGQMGSPLLEPCKDILVLKI